MASTPDIPPSTNAPSTVDTDMIGASAVQVRHSGRQYSFDFFEPVAPQAIDTLYMTPEQRAEKRRLDDLELKNPNLTQKCLCPDGIPKWEGEDLDGQGKLVCVCGTVSNSFAGIDLEYTCHTGDDLKKNQAKIRHQHQIDQAKRREMFKLDPDEISPDTFTDQLLRHANNRLGQGLVWTKVLTKERAGPNQIFLTTSEIHEMNRVIRGATKVWINLPADERDSLEFASAVLWVCAIALTLKARAEGGAFTFPTEKLCSMGTMRGLHAHLGLFKHSVEYQAEEAQQVSTGNKQPGEARDAIHYITHTVTRTASYYSLGRGNMSVYRKMQSLSRLLTKAGVWPNSEWMPGMPKEDKFLGLDRRVMTFKLPKCSANANQVKASAQMCVPIQRKSFGLSARGGSSAKKQRPTMMLPDANTAEPAPETDSWSDGEEEGDAMETADQQWNRFQAGKVAAAKVERKAQKEEKAQNREEVKRLKILEEDMATEAMQANMQANHAQDVAAAADQDGDAETLEYSEAEEEEEEEKQAPVAVSSSAEEQVAQDALTTQSLAAHDDANSGAYSDVDEGDEEGAATEGEATEAVPEDEEDDESVSPGSDVVGDFDTDHDMLPDDIDLDDDTAEAELRVAAASTEFEDAFAAAVASVEATSAMELPLGAAIVDPDPSTSHLPEASRKRINEDGDIDVLAGLRMYSCKEYHLVAKLSKQQALNTANWRQGGAKAERWLNTYLKLSKAYKIKVRAKLEKQGKREAAVAAVAAARVAKREEATKKRSLLSAEAIQRKGEKQYKSMEGAKAKAEKAAAKGDTAAVYFEPTTVLGGEKVLRKLAPTLPTIKINLTTKRAAQARAVLAGCEPPKKKAKPPVSKRMPPGTQQRNYGGGY